MTAFLLFYPVTLPMPHPRILHSFSLILFYSCCRSPSATTGCSSSLSAPFLASQSACSFPGKPTCALTQAKRTAPGPSLTIFIFTCSITFTKSLVLTTLLLPAFLIAAIAACESDRIRTFCSSFADSRRLSTLSLHRPKLL